MAYVRTATRQGRLRALDLLLLVPAIGVGLLLLAVSVSARTGEPVTDLLSPGTVKDLVPIALGTETP